MKIRELAPGPSLAATLRTRMSERFDAVVIGAGPAGEVVLGRLVDQALRTALVEHELVGGECAYWACMP